MALPRLDPAKHSKLAQRQLISCKTLN